ncbi:serine/threonine-protein kinase [Parabacteroides bouchesdurhonensis]|uniref:serine/threonine-protein kinase n=1 Tax=Parabacteroides bouchesdurhonensis TaxID=1936995 RepID=UPI000E4DE931|nr:serine/threonine-protein kinase [Parabacteroides bouchesdurhonensis]RHJ91398.1 serine/threonine protein kinase [Bacteroides sp. AM07-16]
MNLPNGYLLQDGKYRLSHVVGQGGFGITYKGVWFTELKGALGTIKTEVPICVKEYFFKDYCYRDNDSQQVKVHSETGKTLFNKFKEKLIKEAKILSEVHHPYIVNVLEVFEENNTAYIVMEYISGNSLKSMMDKNGVLPEHVVLKYVHQIGEALQFVHEKNILHLDIKPSNILIDKDDNARLIDFGVSKRYDIEEQETSTTMLTLSKGFASIEQYDNEGTQVFSPCPDVYSLGATMYNLLTGRIPTESILRATRPLQNPSEVNPNITSKTESAIIKAMQIIPADRFQSIGEMLGALDMPPEEKHDVRKEETHTDIVSDTGDTTLLYSETSHGEDDDQTIINNKEEISKTNHKKKRKTLLIPLLFIIFVVVGCAAVGYVYSDRFFKKIPLYSDASSGEQNDISETVALSDAKINDEQAVPIQIETENHEVEPVEKPNVPKPDVNATTEEKTNQIQQHITQKPATDVGNNLSVIPSAAELDTKYSALIISGKAKMNATDYTGAKKDFTEAKEIKLTEDVVRLLIACDSKQEEKELADRKALYEELMTFGKYKIVRKKSTGKYGAIDSNAMERIPCKYLSVGKSDNGRAFERTDNLYDIYSPEGVLQSEGLTYY